MIDIDIADNLNAIFWKNVDLNGDRPMKKELFGETLEFINEIRQQERERIIELVSSFEHDLSEGGIFQRRVWQDVVNRIKELK